MTQMHEPSEKSLIEALNQNWQHARHQENERLWFTNIYALLVAGVLVFLGQFGFDKHYYLVLFLLIFSIFGLIVTLKTSYEFSNHMNAIKKIIEKLHLSDYMAYPTVYRGTILGKIIRVRCAFIGFYLIMIFIWVYLLY